MISLLFCSILLLFFNVDLVIGAWPILNRTDVIFGNSDVSGSFEVNLYGLATIELVAFTYNISNTSRVVATPPMMLCLQELIPV
jgi:hypothetical protein